jgi:protein-histidine pros-kinase
MKLPWPRTLFARLMLIWLVGLAAVLATSYALFLGERHRFDRDVLFEGLAREIAAAADVLDQLTPAEREQWIEALGRRRLRFALAPPPPDARPLPERIALTQALRRAQPDRAITLFAQQPRGNGGPPHARLFAAMQLADGSALTIRLPVPHSPATAAPTPPERVLAALVALVAGVSLLAWIAVRVATRPLSKLADAARALGEDPNRPAVDTSGPAEVAQAAAAFNQMQQRIREHVGERTRILAAISHDLQTPITRLRLRVEQIDDDALRARIQSDLDAMQALAKEGLDYARSLDATAPLQAVDVNALVDALCEDARDMGWQVACEGRVTRACRAQVAALRRALWNLIENGVKFGERVDVTLGEVDDAVTVQIRDHGPGLPAAELERVFEPFYRTEASRNRETGGTGLGLAIARNLLRAQGGDVTLANAAGGGLAATVRLPGRPVERS